MSIGISGCPNNCSHAAVADIGLIGLKRTVGGGRQECFRLLAGGGKGANATLARELHPAVPARLVHKAVQWLADQYAAAARPKGQSFQQFVAARGGNLSRGIGVQF